MRYTPSPTALEGMAGHALVQSRRDADYEAEIKLAGQYENLRVRGRADGFDPRSCQLEEIKTYRGSLEGIRAHQRSLHWAQAKVYGHLLCQARELKQLTVAVIYFNILTEEEAVLAETFEAPVLQLFFEEQCARFLQWAHLEAAHRQARDEALQALPFPMERFRTGQRELAVAVYRCARPADGAGGGRCLMAQAPTGIGKTLGTVFPMLKACTSEGLDKIFFLTAKGTGHGLALQALALINQKIRQQTPPQEPQQDVDKGSSGVIASPCPAKPWELRILDMQAREKTCEHPDKACHGESCPLAKGFYDRLPAARAQAVQSGACWDAPAVRSLALAHQICPYYLSQELAQWSDVIVADYHYYYGGSATLFALVQERQWKAGVLVDEAHNLVERARSMYTAELSPEALAGARSAASGAVRKALDRVFRHWNALARNQATDYQAFEEVPSSLLASVQRAAADIGLALADQPLIPSDPVLAFYWEALHFLALAEQFGGHALFDVTLLPGSHNRRGGSASRLAIRNVVPAAHLRARHAAAHATTLFSGTLTPPDFYRDLLGLPEEAGWIDVQAPFQADQLNVRTVGHISTRYRDRNDSLRPIAELVAQQYDRQPGNYLCFFSSFDYLQRAADCLQSLYPQLPLWQQTPRMDAEGRQAFLARFTEHERGIGLAVLGGAFSEGVDLPGQRLIGAFVATLGLPQINPVNDEIKRAMDRHFGTHKGYDYTYLYPGLRKVVQAAGRVIRTEQDRGSVFLIDDRYQRASVRALLPAWWQVRPHHQAGS